MFNLPGATHTNNAMQNHWGKNAEGVLAHARVQDFDTADGKMLFVEEIQSDWHNEGHSKGYVSDGKKLDTDIQDDIAPVAEAVPDAPFKDTYHEFVLKRLIREAAENGYDSIGWTTADIQSQRWSDEFAEGYRIEYAIAFVVAIGADNSIYTIQTAFRLLRQPINTMGTVCVCLGGVRPPVPRCSGLADSPLLLGVRRPIFFTMDVLTRTVAEINPCLTPKNAVLRKKLLIGNEIGGSDPHCCGDALTAGVGLGFYSHAIDPGFLNVRPDRCGQVRAVQIVIALAAVDGTTAQIAVTNNGRGIFVCGCADNGRCSRFLRCITVPAPLDRVPAEFKRL